LLYDDLLLLDLDYQVKRKYYLDEINDSASAHHA